MRKIDKLQWLTEEIARSKDFLSEIDSRINNYKDEKHEENIKLYNEWNSNVYDIIKQTIKDEVNNNNNSNTFRTNSSDGRLNDSLSRSKSISRSNRINNSSSSSAYTEGIYLTILMFTYLSPYNHIFLVEFCRCLE